MSSIDTKARRIAFAGTTIIVALVLLLLWLCYMPIPVKADEKEHDSGIVLDEEFVDFLDMPALPDMTGIDPSRATADEVMESQPTPVAGTDTDNSGDAGDPAPVVSSSDESPMKVQNKDQKKPEGPVVDKKKQEEDAIRRQADNEVANAFNKSKGNHNNANGSDDKGNSGVADGNAPQGSLTGRGTGTAGGGWAIPNYAAVQSPVTGSVKMTVTIDRQGNVTAVQFTGGDAPAATNTAVRNACAAEVKSRRFLRSNPDDAPESSKAYITYTFK